MTRYDESNAFFNEGNLMLSSYSPFLISKKCKLVSRFTKQTKEIEYIQIIVLFSESFEILF